MGFQDSGEEIMENQENKKVGGNSKKGEITLKIPPPTFFYSQRPKMKIKSENKTSFLKKIYFPILFFHDSWRQLMKNDSGKRLL